MKKRFLFSTILVFLCFLATGQNNKIVILHTNDTHSQIEPTEKNAVRNADMGGYARRAGVINQIRQQEPNVLLLDAGDFSQGTPFYNFYKGRVEIQGYNLMNYDAVMLGNHEFDNGMDSLAMLLKMAKFPVIVSNYDAKGSLLSGLIKPYKILSKAGMKIGIMGLGVNPAGLIMEKNYAGIKYKDPVKTAQYLADFLKKKRKCDLVICLSHLGSDSTELKINDFSLAHQTRNIDVIIGGHSHTMLENVKTINMDGKAVMIAQMAKSGLFLGRIDVLFSKQK
jgi:5'-nucleotidase